MRLHAVGVPYTKDQLAHAREDLEGQLDGFADRAAQVAADAGATVLLSNHSEYDSAYTKARLVSAKREVGESHPFIVGADGVQRYFTVMAECALASKLRLGAKP